jgi:tRNA(Ile)-lysidine synthase
MDHADFLSRVQAHIDRHELIPPDGAVTVLVSGGADSTCAWHLLRELGYRVSALHVDHGLRGHESDEDARFCRELMKAEIVDGRGGTSEEKLREIRYGFATDRLRASGHTASDQVETVLYRLVTSGRPTGIKAKREDGVVRPLLPLWRNETEAYCRAHGIEYRTDSSNSDTTRGRIRERILPLLRELHPAADENLLRALERRPTLQPAVADLIASPVGSKRLDLGDGIQLVREYDRAWLERGPVALEGTVHWGAWTIESELAGLKVRGWRPGDRLAGRRKKIQDVFVDAKIPRSDREAWPLVVRGRDVIAVPGIIEADGVRAIWAGDDSSEGGDYPNAIVGPADMGGATDANPEGGGSRGKPGFPRESEPEAKRNAD